MTETPAATEEPTVDAPQEAEAPVAETDADEASPPEEPPPPDNSSEDEPRSE